MPPFDCVAGARLTEYGGASGETNGEPVVPTPTLEVTVTPSLTIDVKPFLAGVFTVTEKCTWTFPPAGTVSPLQVAVPPKTVPPSCATALPVLAGTGSVIVTPVASTLPMFLSVSV